MINRIAFIDRTADTAGFVLEVVCIAVVIEQAPENNRAHVATEEISGRRRFGWRHRRLLGGWPWRRRLGRTWAAPTLVIPVVGKITEGGAILIGGIAGALFFGSLGHKGGKSVGVPLWHLATVQWKSG